MNTMTSREQHLRALGIAPLRLLRQPATTPSAEPAPAAVTPQAARIARLALQPDPAELADPAIRTMYTALTAAVSQAGLQIVRVCDVADDATAAVMVFGAAPLPDGVPAVRVLRADPLRVIYTDHERKRLLWEQMQALGRRRED